MGGGGGGVVTFLLHVYKEIDHVSEFFWLSQVLVSW